MYVSIYNAMVPTGRAPCCYTGKMKDKMYKGCFILSRSFLDI